MSQQRDLHAGQRPKNRCNAIDTHEILKQEIYKQSYDGDSGFRFGLNIPPAFSDIPGGGIGGAMVGFEDTPLYFDSVFRDTSSDYSSGEIKWSITALNNTQEIKNCIQLHIGHFFFPKIYSVYDGSNKPEYFYYRKVYMEFQNAPSNQAVLAPNNRYHFEFDVENLTGQAVDLVPIEKSFFFQRPITYLVDFQIRFMVPQMTSTIWKRIPLPHETVAIRAVPASNPIRFDILGTDNTTVLGPLGATGVPGIAVFITGLATNDATVNNLSNDSNGNYVTTIVTATRFEIGAINGAAVNAAMFYNASMYIPKNRIAFPVRFTSVRDQLTNYIKVEHN